MNRKTGKKDKNGNEIKEGDEIKYFDPSESWRDDYTGSSYFVKWGKGTYDSGYYSYIGFYCEDARSGDSDGFGYILTADSQLIEIVTSKTEACDN